MSAVTAGKGRPKDGYFTEDGTRIPGVTTITGRFKDSGGLIRWAWAEGRDGRQLYESRDKAAEAGGICHDWIEDFIHGRPRTHRSDVDEALLAQAETGYGAFTEWAEQVRVEVLETEVPLISETYRFGGTFDALALVAGKRMLLDWKTSNASHREYIAQLAAYRELLRERDGDEAPTGAQLLRVGKTFADFHVHSWPESILDLGWRFFLHARRMYDLDKELKKVAS